MTQEVSDAMLMALADGELPHDEASALKARVAGDPVLAERYAVFAETRSALKAAYAANPVPDRLVRAILSAPLAAPEAAADFTRRGVLRFRPGARRSASLWPVALAASLALAVGIGGFLAGQVRAPGADGVVAGPQAAAMALAGALTGATADLGGGRSARVLASFDTDLGLCRLIALEGSGGASERTLACREDAAWQVVLSVVSGGGEAFLPASDLAVATVDSFLDNIGAGPVLDPDEEARALTGG